MNTLTVRTSFLAATLLAAVVALSGCGGSDGGSDAPAASGSGGDKLTVAVSEPASGATVNAPFQVKVDSSVPLGPTESGRHHVHIWFDDNEDDYMVVESDTTQVTKAPAGSHTMHVSLRNANHSAAGAEASVPVTVGAGGPAAGSPSGAGNDTGPYGY